MPGKNDILNIYCSFCGKPQDMVGRLIKGNSVYICDQCVDLCVNILEDGELDKPLRYRPHNDYVSIAALPKPQEIKAILDDYVIGQEDAKIALCVAVYNHYKRVFHRDTDVEFAKSNVLLLGPTGVGKTLLAQTLAKALDVPFAIADATTLTEAGYVGEDVENILLKLIQAADYDIKKAEQGIIYIDEIDKITRKSENPSITRDVSGEGVQQALLKIIEGTVSNVPPQGGRKHPQQEFLQIDTKDILFICGGAFEGLDKVVERRIGSSAMGFEANVKATEESEKSRWMRKVISQDLVKYGLIPELVGRLPVITVLDALDEESLIQILSVPKNSIVKQYEKLFEMDDTELNLEADALKEIAKKAKEQNTGARGLRSIMENLLKMLMFESPSDNTIDKITITADVVKKVADPIIERSSGKKNVRQLDIKQGKDKKRNSNRNTAS